MDSKQIMLRLYGSSGSKVTDTQKCPSTSDPRTKNGPKRVDLRRELNLTAIKNAYFAPINWTLTYISNKNKKILSLVSLKDSEIKIFWWANLLNIIRSFLSISFKLCLAGKDDRSFKVIIIQSGLPNLNHSYAKFKVK